MMVLKLKYKGKKFRVNLDKPIDISIPLISGSDGPNCFWAPKFEIAPVKTDAFIGSIEEGGLLNFKNVKINPHGNGTHTECVGHIEPGPYFINDCLTKYHFIAKLVTIDPELQENGDYVITKSQMENNLGDEKYEALIIRTLPNSDDKLNKVYSGNNPTYVSAEAMSLVVEHKIDHFIIDQPSVDREEDGGKLASHNIFWKSGKKIAKHKTITEMVYVPDTVPDGLYFLNIQIASFMMDASPSKLILYKILD
jgi:kynurenine formamidase